MRVLYDPNEIVTSKYIREEYKAIASLRILVKHRVSGECKYIWAKVYGEGGKLSHFSFQADMDVDEGELVRF